MILSARALLRELDPLPYPERQRRLAGIARGGDTALVAELAAGDAYARGLALRLAVIGGDAAQVERFLMAPETALRGRALVAAVRLRVRAAAVAAVVDDLPTALRRTLYSAVRAHRHTELAELLLPTVRTRFGDVEAAALLTACGGDAIAAALPELGHAVTRWHTLAQRHPAVVLDHLDAELERTPRRHWPELWGRLGPTLADAAEALPDRVLGLLERTAGEVAIPSALWRTIGMLARHDSRRLLAVLLDPRRIGSVPASRGLWRALLGCADNDLAALARVLGGDQLVRFLHTLPPSRRAAVYAGAVGERDLIASGVPLAALDELPRAAREAEAQRLLGLRSAADDPDTRLAVTARTAWESAQPVLVEATRRATAEERAHAYPLAVGAAAATRDPEAFGAYLATLTRLRNEQDPVRSAALNALAEVPPWLFRDADVPLLTTFVTDAAEARDRSWMSEQAVRALATRLIREGAASRRPALVECGVDALGRLGATVSRFELSGLDRALPRGAEHDVFETLRPRLDADARRGRFEMTLALAYGLGRRAWDMPELQSRVGQARRARDDAVVREAIRLWLAPRGTRAERVEQVLRGDRSTITIPAVAAVAGRLRTDLLDDVLTKRLHGRFLPRGVRFIPSFRGCFHAWLPRQHARYVRLLTELAAQETEPVHHRVAAIRAMRGVPGSTVTLHQLSASTEVAVAEAALGALAWTEEPEAELPDLLEEAGGDRARVAMYAATRCASFTTPYLLGELLAPVLSGAKITSRKEAVRLVAEHRVPGASELLAGVFRDEGQHRDVRRAVVSACRLLLDEPVVWEILSAATADEHAVALAVLDTAPGAVPERYRGRYAEMVRAVAASAEADTAGRGLQALPPWSRWDAGGADFLVALITDLATTATWRHAVTPLVATALTTGEPNPVLVAMRTLLGVDDTPPRPDRDLPARQRLRALVEEVTWAATHESGRPLANGVVTLLTGDDHRATAVDLALAAVPWESTDPAPLRQAHTLAASPVVRWQANAALRAHLSRVVARLSPDGLLAMARTLVDDAPAFAVAVTQIAGRHAGWPPPWRELLAELRAHADPDVRREALSTFTSPE